jgi:hypothetical protein
MAAPATDRELLAEAVALCREGGLSPKAAAEALASSGRSISYRTIYRALKEAPAAPAAPRVAIVPHGPDPSAEAPVEVPAGVAAAALGTADPEKAAALRRMLRAGKYDASTVERLAATWSCSAADVRALVVEAAILAGEQALPPELAREESLEVARRVRRKAEESADWKSVLAAQAHIDRVQLAAGKPGTAPDGLTAAEVVSLLRRIVAAVRHIPGAVAAVRAVIEPT